MIIGEELDSTITYILFNDKYDFDNLPNGFDIEVDEGFDYPRTLLECKTSYYDKNNKHLNMLDVLKELDDKCKELYEWVKKLPNNN